MQIAIVYSIPTKRAQKTSALVADEDTKEAALEVAEALRLKGFNVTLVPLMEDSFEESLRTMSTDLIFNVVEWDGHDIKLSYRVFSLLEQKGIPIVGGTLENLRLTSDKQKMKAALQSIGVLTPRWQVFETGNEPIRTDFHYPVIVKLLNEHCSIGLTRDAVVKEAHLLPSVIASQLKIYHEAVIVEEFIAGREFQVTVLEKESGLTVLPPAEIVFTSADPNAFLTYESRWVETDPDYKTSHVELARLSPSLNEKLVSISKNVFSRLGYRDYSRLDIRVRGDDVYVLEANTNPGLGDDDDYGMTVSYKAAGMTFADFIWEIVQSTLRRA